MNLETLLTKYGNTEIEEVWDHGYISIKDEFLTCCSCPAFCPVVCANCSQIMVYCWDCGNLIPDPLNPHERNNELVCGGTLWTPRLECFKCDEQFVPALAGDARDVPTLHDWMDAGYGFWIKGLGG